MDKHTFGYCESFPEDTRHVFAALTQDVQMLHEKWGLYLDLFGSDDSTDLLSDTAAGTFQVIEEAMRHDMTMAFGRLLDPARTGVKNNISFATLAEKIPDCPELHRLIAEFRAEAEPIERHRNKQVGHNDLNTALHPKDHPLPGIGRQRVDRLIGLAASIMNTALGTVEDAQLMFRPAMLGDGRSLLEALKIAQDHRQQEQRRLLQEYLPMPAKR